MSRILTGSRTLWPMARFQSSFAAGKRGDFFQTKPEITNQFLEDPFLIEQLELEIPEPVKTLFNHTHYDSPIYLNKKKLLVFERYTPGPDPVRPQMRNKYLSASP